MYSNKKSIWRSLFSLIGIVSVMGGGAYLIINYSRPTDLYDGFYYEAKKHLTKKEGFEWKSNNRVFFNYSKNNIDLDNKIIPNPNFPNQSDHRFLPYAKSTLQNKILKLLANSRLSFVGPEYSRIHENKNFVFFHLRYEYKNLSYSRYLAIEIVGTY